MPFMHYPQISPSNLGIHQVLGKSIFLIKIIVAQSAVFNVVSLPMLSGCMLTMDLVPSLEKVNSLGLGQNKADSSHLNLHS